MYFASDNHAGAHPRISQRLEAEAGGYAAAYGDSELDRLAAEKFNAVFGREVTVFFVATGTAANSLALTAANRPGGVAFCHECAHLIVDECGAFEYLSGGSRLRPVAGAGGKVDPKALESAILEYPADFVHHGQPMAVSITQSTEIGTVYSLQEIAAIAAVASRHGIPLHMDGARFANSLAALGVSPGAMTHEAGVDMLSFGATKNGCWCAEAVVFFDPVLAESFAFLRKRAAQLFSKSRFIAAQFLAYFEADLWLETARHANAMAQALAARISQHGAVRQAWAPQANEVFAVMTGELARELQGKGARFHPWTPPRDCPVGADEVLCRFVTSFATTQADIDAFGALLER